MSKSFTSFKGKMAEEATTLATKDRNNYKRRQATKSETKYKHFDCNKAEI